MWPAIGVDCSQGGCGSWIAFGATVGFIFAQIDLTKSKVVVTFCSIVPSIDSNFADHPLGQLPREDLDLITKLVLRSGSLKDLAQVYGVSYPTIRGRLDRVIERLEQAVKGRQPDPLMELMARLVERGELSIGGAHAIRRSVREMVNGAASSAEHSGPVVDRP